MKILLALAITLWMAATALAAPPPSLTAPVVDPAGLLSTSARTEIKAAAEAFRKATGRWLVVVAVPDVGAIDPAAYQDTVLAPWEPAESRTPIGIVYVLTPGTQISTLFVVDPDWRRVALHQWIAMFPQRLVQKYADEPFDRRAVLGAQYFAEVFPDKIAFLLRPASQISADSVEFAENVMTVIKYFVYFIILFTFYRTIWPARVRDEDDDEFSNELRRLAKERSIW